MFLYREAFPNPEYRALNMINEERVLKNVERSYCGIVGDVGSRNFRGVTEENHEESQYARCPFSIRN